MNIEEILNDPTVSFWLKRAIKELLNRDCVDALRDAEILVQIMKDKCK